MVFRELYEADISEALLNAPGWARVGLTTRDPRLRESAAAELAKVIRERIEGPVAPGDEGQLTLAL
jgi:hypothetical protein